ncbi:ppsA, partial [Symbiodinium pilosum]
KPGLQAADTLLAQMGNELTRVDSMLESHFSSRSSLILHKAGIPADCDVPELTPAACQKWLEVFGHSRIMLILFLGPGYGRLEFQPLDAEGLEPYEVDVGPGTLAIVRADGVSHRFFSTARSLAVSCFLLEDAVATWRRRFGVPLITTPVCRDLMDWAKERWELAKRQSLTPDDLSELPPQWQRMANQAYQVGPQVAVKGTSCKFPSSYNAAGYWCGMQAGCDLVVEVPFSRWDHTDFFNKDPESWKWGATNCRHGSFIDGIEMFDNRFFNISPVESRGMDPAQRHILETSYEALYFSGYSKKSLMRSLLGVYIGAAATEMNLMPATALSSGTGGASSITSNRISFCLGLQGPSFTMDAQGASSLAALTQGSMSLRFQTEHYKPNTAALVGGAYLMITGTSFILLSAKGHLSPQGRCFSFDQSAEGYAKSEGISNLVLELLRDDPKEGEPEVNGIIAATHSNHTGRSASLTAPNGAQEGELVIATCKQAAISPSSVDAVECFSHGLPLHDAVEATVLRRFLRGHAEVEAPLCLGTGFTASGMGLECAGMAQILKVLVGQKYGAITPLLHLHQLNPEIEFPDNDDAALFSSEEIRIEGLSSYTGITGKGIGGTMCHAITLGTLRTPDAQAPPEDAPRTAPREAMQLAAGDFWLRRQI